MVEYQESMKEEGSVKGRDASKFGGDVNFKSSMEWTKKEFLRLSTMHLISSKREPRCMYMDYPGIDVFDADNNQVPGSILITTLLP